MIDLRLGDCLDVMPTFAAQSFDAIIADIPYGTTACKWDTVIPFAPMWAELKRLAKPKAAIVLFGSQPFTSALVMSNPQWFRYEWVWNKRLAGNGILAGKQPLKIHESVVVFSANGHTFNEQMTIGKARYKGGIKDNHGTFGYSESGRVFNDAYHSVSILDYSGAGMRSEKEHPTQKPVALMEYLIRTYTNEGDTVLDFTMGSGTTLVACVNTRRNGTGIEKDAGYYAIAERRVKEAQAQMAMPMVTG